MFSRKEEQANEAGRGTRGPAGVRGSSARYDLSGKNACETPGSVTRQTRRGAAGLFTCTDA